MTFKFAYSTNVYTLFPLKSAIERIGARGFDGVEILADIPHAVPSRLAAREIDDIRKTLTRCNLAVSNVNVNTSLTLDKDGRDPSGFWPSFIDPDRDARAMKIGYIGECLQMARDLGADCVSIATGRRPPSIDIGKADELLTESLEAILASAEKFGVKVGIECEPEFHVASIEKLLALIKAFRHPLLGANLDIGHCVVEGDDPVAAVRSLGEAIWNIHFEDIAGRVHRHLIPGEGEIDFTSILKTIADVGYRRYVTLELYPYKEDPDGAGQKGLDHIKRIVAGM